MNLKYISVGVLAVIIALFYFMHQSNEASAERLKQAEIANQQRLEQNKIDEIRAEKNLELGRIQTEKTKALEVEQAKNAQLQQIEASQKQQVEQKELETTEFKKYQEISDKWMAQDSIASSTARIALSTPVTELRKIRDELKSTPITGCLSQARDELLLAMDANIYTFVYFMQNDIRSTKKTNELKISYLNHLSEALKTYTPCKNKYGI